MADTSADMSAHAPYIDPTDSLEDLDPDLALSWREDLDILDRQRLACSLAEAQVRRYGGL